jgi:hypothetical protein
MTLAVTSPGVVVVAVVVAGAGTTSQNTTDVMLARLVMTRIIDQSEQAE